MTKTLENMEMTAEERSQIAYERTISDLMDDIEYQLRKRYDRKMISRDEYLDGLETLRESAENEYQRNCAPIEEEQYGFEESDWDDLQDYEEAY